MKQQSVIWLSAILLTFFPYSAKAASVGDGAHCGVWGQALGSGNPSDGDLRIELAGKGVKRQQVALVNGNFDFRSVPPGVYQFRVKDRRGQVLLKRVRALTGANGHVLLVLSSASGNRPPTGTISLRELGNHVLERARSAFLGSEKALESGEIEKSLKFMESAVAIDPQFTEAQVNLGAKYARAGRDQEALQHLESAFEQDPRSPDAVYDLVTLLMLTKDYSGAEAVARRFLQGGENWAVIQGALALSLIWQDRNLDEAYQHLRQAAGDFPIARLMAAKALAGTGRPIPAIIQLREYLHTAAHPCEREELTAWLAGLEAWRPPGASGQD